MLKRNEVRNGLSPISYFSEFLNVNFIYFRYHGISGKRKMAGRA